MKILSVVSDSIRGGATISFINLVVGLKRRGVEVVVVTPRSGYLTEVLQRNGIKYFVISFGFSVWPFNQGRNIIKHTINYKKNERQAVDAVKRIAIDFNPDLIHTNVSVVNIGYKVARSLNVPHVWHIREYGDLDFDLHIYPSKCVFKRWLDNSWSIAITKDLKKYFGEKKRCRVIYNGIKDKGTITNLDKKKKTFIYVGRVTPNKGAEDIIKAFIEFGRINNDFELQMLGSVTDEYLIYLKGLISGTSVDGRVTFAGSVTDVDKRMQEAWAIIVPSFYEGFGRITAEAMFNGCLVIGRNTAGTKEQLDNGMTSLGREIGLRFDSIKDLVNRLETVSKISISEMNRYIRDAKRVVEDLYTNERNVDETYNYLCDILSK